MACKKPEQRVAWQWSFVWSLLHPWDCPMNICVLSVFRPASVVYELINAAGQHGRNCNVLNVLGRSRKLLRIQRIKENGLSAIGHNVWWIFWFCFMLLGSALVMKMKKTDVAVLMKWWLSTSPKCSCFWSAPPLLVSSFSCGMQATQCCINVKEAYEYTEDMIHHAIFKQIFYEKQKDLDVEYVNLLAKLIFKLRLS